MSHRQSARELLAARGITVSDAALRLGVTPGWLRVVLNTSEAREAAPELARRYREQGINGEVVFFGSHRRPDAAVVPAALLEALAPYLEDLVVAERVRERLRADDGTRVSLAELDRRNRWTAGDIAAEAADLRRELGIS
jgi:antitoxin StbD